jgi:hypothetical protein
MPRDTGFPGADARDDFLRVRRAQVMSRMARRVSRAGDVDLILPFDEVVEALGRVGERSLGLQLVDVDSIVGTVDRTRGFDRSFRPTSSTARGRWERIANMVRRGEPLPPVQLYRIGDVHFVRDGHHRVSVARALGRTEIDAYVTEVLTRVGAERSLRASDLPLKSNERLFRERVPLPPEDAAQVRLSDPARYPLLAEGVEAWGFRVMQDRTQFLDRRAVARTWFGEEFRPVVALLREADLLGTSGTEADAYLRMAEERYRLLRTHEWSEDVIRRLAREL